MADLYHCSSQGHCIRQSRSLRPHTETETQPQRTRTPSTAESRPSLAYETTPCTAPVIVSRDAGSSPDTSLQALAKDAIDQSTSVTMVPRRRAAGTYLRAAPWGYIEEHSLVVGQARHKGRSNHWVIVRHLAAVDSVACVRD
jgi:hypothetical protein